MPRAATAIIAIACSTSYLGPETGIVPSHALRCDAKSKRPRALAKRVVSKQPLISDYEASGKQDEAILATLTSWSPADIENFSAEIESLDDLDSGTDAFSELGDDSEPLSEGDDHAAIVRAIKALTPTTKALIPTTKRASKDLKAGHVAAAVTLPDDLLLTALKYTGATSRAVCRSAQRSCDSLLHESLLLPTFPVNLSVKQHYHFNSQRPITTKWSLDVEAPSTPCSLEVCTESCTEDNAIAHQSSQSGAQVLRLCQELRTLQTELGVSHRENGRTQVEIVATDAAGRTLLDHAYDHRIFSSKADDLLELLTESELHVSSASSVHSPASSDDDMPQSPARSLTHLHRGPRARPASRSRS